MAHDRVDLQIGLAPRGVDRAVAGGDRAQTRLQRAHRHLVAPVQALLVGGNRRRARPARSGPGRRRSRRGDGGEGADERASGAGLPQRVRVGERDDLAARVAHGGVLRADLAAAGQLQHDVGAGLSRPFGRGVRAAIAGDDQLQQLARIVERERVLDLCADHRLLVVSGDDQRQGGERPGRRRPPSRSTRAGHKQARDHGKRDGVAELGPHDQRRGQPEEDLEHGGHRPGFSRRSDS